MSAERREKPKPKSKKTKRRFSLKKLFGWSIAAAALAMICAMAGYLVIILNGQKLMEDIVSNNRMDMAEASVIYDANDEVVTTLYRENREIVEFGEIPQLVKDAFIATEDKRFYEHQGLDFWSIGRALYKDILHRSIVEGGSTITQQLAKNMFLTSEKTLFRKATEASIAVALEGEKSKDEILEMYLNNIFFGQGTYGIKTASKKYFGKDNLHDLELWEIATLAGIPKAPSAYNPISNPEKSKERREIVLQLMYEQGYITEQQRNEAAAVEYVPIPQANRKDYLTFLDYVTDQATELTGLTEDELLRGGYRIYTTMDPKAQKIMEQTFNNPDFFQKDGPSQKIQGSMVIIDHKDGSLIAMVGGRDYVSKGLNRALAKRQPGSSFKPLAVYAPALESGQWNPYSRLTDERLSYNGYSPRNYDNRYDGTVNMITALKKSKNAATVWLLNEMKLNGPLDFITNKLEIPLDKERDANLAIALGGLTEGVSPLNMAKAYGAFANQGKMNDVYAIRYIQDKNGKDIYRYQPDNPKVVMKPETAWYLTEMLKEAVDSGTGVKARMNRPVAGKTGTTQLDLKGLEKYDRDIWFVGYTPEWTAAVWMGFDKTDNKHYVTIGSGATATIFKEVMSKALADRKVTAFAKPANVPDLKAPPAVVTDLAAVREDQAVRLTWTSNQPNAEFKLMRKGSKEEDFQEILRTPMTSVRDNSILEEDTYQYFVIAYNPDSGAESERSNTVEVDFTDSGDAGLSDDLNFDEDMRDNPDADSRDSLPGRPDNDNSGGRDNGRSGRTGDANADNESKDESDSESDHVSDSDDATDEESDSDADIESGNEATSDSENRSGLPGNRMGNSSTVRPDASPKPTASPDSSDE